MKLSEIKQAVREGKIVNYKTQSYNVVMHTLKSGEEQWLIKCTINGYCIGLTWQDEVTMNGKEEDFYIN